MIDHPAGDAYLHTEGVLGVKSNQIGPHTVLKFCFAKVKQRLDLCSNGIHRPHTFGVKGYRSSLMIDHPKNNAKKCTARVYRR